MNNGTDNQIAVTSEDKVLTPKEKKKREKALKISQKKEYKLQMKLQKAKRPKKHFGDRWDGRRVRTLPPMMYAVPFIMKDRNDASNFFRGRVDMDIINQYQRKRKGEMKGLGFMHILVAAYVRVLSQKPALNRFIAGQRIYKRDDIRLSMVVKKSLDLNAQESTIKVIFEPTDTVKDVFEKMEKQIAVAREAVDSNSFDRVVRGLFVLPALVFRFFIGLLKFLDYFGLMPKALDNVSPFHASFFITNLGSLGIPPIYHHLYNFGVLPVFISFGAPYIVKTGIYENGVEKVKKYLDYTVVMDERITDGHYYASAFRLLEHLFKHPEELDNPPEQVIEDID